MGVFKSWLKRTQGIDLDAPNSGPMDRWKPENPDAARTPNKGSDLEGSVSTSPQAESGTGWVDAPATSHIEKMHFLYGGNPDDSMETGRTNQSRFVRRFLNNESVITVRFRPSGNSGGAEYAYMFDDHALALDIWEDLITSPHPYGEVLYPRMRKAGVPYKPIWKG